MLQSTSWRRCDEVWLKLVILSEKEFSHVPASPPAMRNLSCATAAQFKPTRSTNAGIPSLRLNLIISRPPRDAAMQFEQLNRREFITLAGGQLRRDNRGHVCSSRGPLPPP